MEIPKKLKDEIWEYCRLNDITDLNAFMGKMLNQGFNIEKYGTTPFSINQPEKEIVEKIIEVPVEVIKEVEKIVEKEVIKEVPVEKIIEVIKEVPVEVFIEKTNDEQQEQIIKEVVIEKVIEVPVEKEIFIDNKDEVKKLQQQIENLKVELELEKNRNYTPPKKETPIEEENKKNGLNNIISWVSRTERSGKDIYGE